MNPPDPPTLGLLAVPLAGARIGAPAGDLVLVEWRDPGGGTEPPHYIAPLHVHHEDDEAWYVLAGTLTVRLDGEDVRVPAGGAVIAPRGTAHTYWNPGPEPARYVLVMTRRIEGLIAALHALAAPSETEVAAVFRAHAGEYLGWP